MDKIGDVAFARLPTFGGWHLFLLLCCLLPAAGCGRGSSLDVRTVAGTVKVDGVPLAEGRITLRGLSGDTRGFSSPIERGKYRVEAFPGKAHVSITAYRDVPGKMDSGGPGAPPVPVREQFIPARYNDQTELEIDVPQGGNRSLNFDLSSAPAAAAAAPNR
ncbi:MAG: hypothetical protein ACK6DO_02850 [Planctomycetia bacterium]|jgi:hypothetical protein